MNQTYQITGMTCKSCVARVSEVLLNIESVTEVIVSLEKSEAIINSKSGVSISDIEAVLPSKYTVLEKGNSTFNTSALKETKKSKWQQLKPLFLIFIYLFGAAVLLHFKDWNIGEAMLDFMGLFYIVFSFFKLLDLKGFPDSFRMYDPLAKVIPVYGWVYPFIELALGLFFLMRFQISIALVLTIIILGITTVGVTKTLMDKKSIQCACLGTALKLPMTEATFIENAIMLVMAITMLFMSV